MNKIKKFYIWRVSCACAITQPNSDLAEAAVVKFVEVNAAPLNQLAVFVKFLNVISKPLSGKIIRIIFKDKYE
jgi:hypothetical protein